MPAPRRPLRTALSLAAGCLATTAALTACGASGSAQTAAAPVAAVSSAAAVSTPLPAAPSSPTAAASPATATAPAASPAQAIGHYIDYAAFSSNRPMYSAGKVVLFFHAPWCPDCVRTEKHLKADPASIPAGLTIVHVDYDSSTELKQKYGVTHQWTFVAIDAAGAKQAIWTGTDTGAEIAAKA